MEIESKPQYHSPEEQQAVYGVNVAGYGARRGKRKVFVATYTNEGLKFQIHLGPLKFERSKRGGDYTSRKIPVATI